MTVYFFSGLGADETVFQKLVLPSDWNVVHVIWLEVERKETLIEYCNRLSTQINTTETFSFVGLSFGGIVATELSKVISPKHLILISSISNKNELSFYYKIAGFLGLHKIIPATLLASTSFITFWFFGVKSKTEKALLRNAIKKTSPKFIKWAISQILSWKNKERLLNVFHIHGTADRLFWFLKVKADVRIEKGGHFMVYNRAEEISTFIVNEISKKFLS